MCFDSFFFVLFFHFPRPGENDCTNFVKISGLSCFFFTRWCVKNVESYLVFFCFLFCQRRDMQKKLEIKHCSFLFLQTCNTRQKKIESFLNNFNKKNFGFLLTTGKMAYFCFQFFLLHEQEDYSRWEIVAEKMGYVFLNCISCKRNCFCQKDVFETCPTKWCVLFKLISVSKKLWFLFMLAEGDLYMT